MACCYCVVKQYEGLLAQRKHEAFNLTVNLLVKKFEMRHTVVE